MQQCYCYAAAARELHDLKKRRLFKPLLETTFRTGVPRGLDKGEGITVGVHLSLSSLGDEGK